MTILMCRPDYYGIEYEINPWMSVGNPVDRELATKQWQELFLAYRRLGQAVELVEPRPGKPDMVFTANAGLVHDGKAVLSRFAHAERQAEEPFWWAALYDRNFRIKLLPAGLAFEGAGDALFVGDRLFAGYGFRTDFEAHRAVGAALGVEVVSVELVNPRFYHLDTCFCPLTRDVVMYAPEAFTPESARLVRQSVPHVIEVPIEVAQAFVCNGMAVGGRLLSSVGVESLNRDLSLAGFTGLPLPMSEFMKAGGGVRCLSLPLD